jgi:hypothetical protein
VCIGQPSKESRDLVLGFGFDHKMPVIGHHAIGKDGQFFALKGLGDYTLEGFIVFGLLKQRQRR